MSLRDKAHFFNLKVVSIIFVICDGIHVFESLDGKKIIIRNYPCGTKIEINNQQLLMQLLIYLKKQHSFKEICTKFSQMDNQELEKVLNTLKKYGILTSSKEISKTINVMLIGLGTTGSHIANDLKNLSCIDQLIVVDPDIVDYSNIYRQDYLEKDVNKKKIDVIKDRGNKSNKIIGIDKDIKNYKDITEICKKYFINLIIQAGDIPSTRELGKITEKAANIIDIPYIINSGYVSDVVSLPEFYYPNNDYDFNYKHETNNEREIFLQSNKKVPFRIAANVGHIVAQQVVDYSLGKEPIKYRERGFFDMKKYEWRVQKID